MFSCWWFRFNTHSECVSHRSSWKAFKQLTVFEIPFMVNTLFKGKLLNDVFLKCRAFWRQWHWKQSWMQLICYEWVIIVTKLAPGRLQFALRHSVFLCWVCYSCTDFQLYDCRSFPLWPLGVLIYGKVLLWGLVHHTQQMIQLHFSNLLSFCLKFIFLVR